MYIKGSVGAAGQNSHSDVKFIQELLSLVALEDMRIPRVTVDGMSGPRTQHAIRQFQQHYVKLKNPDARIDPDGRSERILVGKVLEIDSKRLDDLAKKYGLTRTPAGLEQDGPKRVIYRSNADPVLSAYTIAVLKLALTFAGIRQCDISSTIRTFADQARIMHDNCARFPNAKSVTDLRAARGWGYAAPGASVEQVYYDHHQLGRDEKILLMRAEIERLYAEGKKVSQHCVSEADFKRTNIFDVPYSSVLAGSRRKFETALMGMSKHVQNARLSSPAKGQPYIEKLIIEDQCWHLEIPQDRKIEIPAHTSLAIA